MLLAAMVALLVWRLTSDAWHIYLLVLFVCMLVATVVVLIRYIAVERARTSSSPSRSEFHWPPAWTVEQYCRALLTFLKMSSWRVQSAESAGADRLYLGLQRERHRITLMCLRPGLTPSDADMANLEAMRQRAGTLVAVLIADAPGRHEPAGGQGLSAAEAGGADPQTLVLNYDALDNLTEALEGGNEEERRALAAQAQAEMEEEEDIDAGAIA